jgi:hypothetical protein
MGTSQGLGQTNQSHAYTRRPPARSPGKGLRTIKLIENADASTDCGREVFVRRNSAGRPAPAVPPRGV